MITIDKLGRIVDDVPQYKSVIQERWCYTCNCGVCLERTNTEYMVWMESTNLMYGRVLAPHWLPGHLQCYGQLAEKELEFRRLQREWAC